MKMKRRRCKDNLTPDVTKYRVKEFGELFIFYCLYPRFFLAVHLRGKIKLIYVIN